MTTSMYTNWIGTPPKILPLPIKVNNGSSTNIVVALVYMRANPRPIFIIAKVTIKGGIVVLDITNPLNTPTRVPAQMEIGIAMIDGTPTLVISPQQRHPDTAITEPTERSIPPNMITIVIPHARITLMDICRMMLERFLTVQNESVMTLSNRQMIKRPMIIPPLYLTVETTFLPKPGKMPSLFFDSILSSCFET